MKQINICILTHNRPQLFKRCIDSVNKNLKTLNTLQKLSFNFIVLCDDGSVNSRQVKLDSDRFTFIAQDEPEDIAENYKRLFEESLKTKDAFTYYLEDDDYLLNGALISLFDAAQDINRKTKSDNYLFNYAHGYGKEFDANYVNNFHFLKFNNFDGRIFEVKEFLKKYDDRHFQLGMLLFKNSSLDIEKFPKGNWIENDYILFENLKGDVKCSSKKLYQQGWNEKGTVNISDSKNKDSKFKSLADYA